MSIIYNWEILEGGLHTNNSQGLTSVVNKIEASLHATETHEGVEYNFKLPVKVQLSQPDPSSFTSYSDLTQAKVDAWIEAVLGTSVVTRFKTLLETEINKRSATKGWVAAIAEPQTENPVLPWA
jgi:hypothetical protein